MAIESRCDPEFAREFPGLDLHIRSDSGNVVGLKVAFHHTPTQFIAHHNGKSYVVKARAEPPISLSRTVEIAQWIRNNYPAYEGKPEYQNG